MAFLPMRAFAAPTDWTDAQVAGLLGRIGYGARPGDVGRVRAEGVDGYIARQLHPELIPAEELQARLSVFPTLSLTPVQLAFRYPTRPFLKALDRFKEKASAEDVARVESMLPPPEQRGNPREVLLELAAQKLVRATSSPRQLEEVMTDFWMNHFNVFWAKGNGRMLVTSHERDVIRPRCLGHFKDLLLATARSPAMLYYLDNWLSSSPSPRARGPKRGLNENYAREIMELHTLGVDGGYTQADVVEVARCFTGWTLRPPREGATFVFRPRMHDDGPKTVLGHLIPPGRGEQDGVDVVDLLARHPATARFISTKLCRRFVSDDPPKGLVDRCSRVFVKTDGDIREVVRTIITSPEFRAELTRRSKIKTPLEFVASAIRVLGANTDGGRQLQSSLARMGMTLYLCQPPTGYPDRAGAWMSAGQIIERLSLASALASGRLAGTRADSPTADLTAIERDPRSAADHLCRTVLGAEGSSATRASLLAALASLPQAQEPSRKPLRHGGSARKDPARPVRTGQESTPARLARARAILLGSPEFQHR